MHPLLSALGRAAPLAAAAALGPPVIHEPWTPLPCPARPVTTAQIEGCFERDVSRADRVVDAKAAAVFRALPTSTARAAFVGGERAWLVYRRRSCAAAAAAYAGGSEQPVAFLTCERRLDRTHAADLAADAQALRHP
ncbi:MAG TPA: lysozyme inhibitor LprI family protein [Gaiellaceae bacterium]|nr:lysozyme inhibitor LprI family protein [Gaiellaceae bacterium]